MLRLCARLVLCVLLLMGAVSVSAQTVAKWSPVATVSATTTLQAGRICYSDGRDIICDTSAPTLGGVGATDRITSGTQVMVINSATGVVSLSTAGTDWGYLHPTGFSYLPYINTLGAQVSGTVSATGVYAAQDQTNVALLKAYNSNDAATSRSRLEIGMVNGGGLVIDGQPSSTTANLTYGRARGVGMWTGASVSGGITMSARSPSGSIYFGTGGGAERMRIDETGKVGIGIISPNATLDVSGTVSSTDVKLAANGTVSGPDINKCTASTDLGRIVYGADNRPYICINR